MECVVVENNHLSVDQNRSRSEELVNCQGDSSCRTTVRDKYRQEYDQVQARIATCSGADQCVAVAKELRALQGDYSARMSEIQEKARMQGLDSLTPAEVREWADLRGAMSNIDASRNLVLHRAQVTGGSEETTQEIVKIMGQTGIAASAGVAGGISKAGVKGTKVNNGNTDKLPNGQQVNHFEESIHNLRPGERVAQIKQMVTLVVSSNGMTKDNRLTKLNNRDVYRGNDGYLYAVDTQHGRFEKVHPKTGKHQGEVDMGMKAIANSIDKSGGHDLKVK
ncbi:hypothetical protein TI10_00025 [Photorhabdus luminescens subsp. luminescens]|nr:hypothetical protein [Photorhabdus luminescens]KMW74228.1 hypothetical protein TI10_00025 [Photorhabdus luminescens subsp. luminescens]